MYPDDLLKIFEDGKQFHSVDLNQSVILRTHQLGELVIVSGSIVVTNPLANPDWPAYTAQAPVGRFPVYFSDARFMSSPKQAHHSVAAMVRFQDAAPTSWQIAWQADWGGEAAQKIDPARDVWGYLNEWGFLAFMDGAAGSALTNILDQDPDAANTIIEEAEDHEPESSQFLIDEQSGLNFVSFPCNGPGVSPAFFGLTEERRVVCLVVDCGFNARDLLL